MSLRLNIFQKGLLLVSVPLLFEIMFVAYLSNLLQQAEQQIEKEQHAKEVILHIDNIRTTWMQAGFAATAYAYVHNPMLWLRYENLLQAVDDEIYISKKLCRADAEQMIGLNEIEACSVDSRAILEHAQTTKDPLKALFPLQKMADSSHPMVRIATAADRIVRQEKKIADKSPALRAEKKNEIRIALWGAIGFNIVLTILSTAFLARNITGRLRFVMDNTHRMVKRGTLNPEVGGSDEIAELDRAIHQTSAELIELETFKRELTAMVTHELRTPLTSIQGILTLLRVGALGQLPDLAQAKVEVAEANSRRLIRLITELLDIEKMEAGKLELDPKPTELKQILTQSVEAVRDFATQYAVTIEVHDSNCMVTADAERVIQVVINLLSNAVKYSPRDSVVHVNVEPAGEAVEVRIVDKGRGIPPEFRDRIFDKFQQVDAKDARDKKGTGLGLAICKAIVEQHGGTIGVESELGHGSTFWFRLNLCAIPVVETVVGEGLAPSR